MKLPKRCTQCRGGLTPSSSVVLWCTRYRVWHRTGARTDRTRVRYVLCERCAALGSVSVTTKTPADQARVVDAAGVAG